MAKRGRKAAATAGGDATKKKTKKEDTTWYVLFMYTGVNLYMTHQFTKDSAHVATICDSLLNAYRRIAADPNDDDEDDATSASSQSLDMEYIHSCAFYIVPTDRTQVVFLADDDVCIRKETNPDAIEFDNIGEFQNWLDDKPFNVAKEEEENQELNASQEE